MAPLEKLEALGRHVRESQEAFLSEADSNRERASLLDRISRKEHRVLSPRRAAGLLLAAALVTAMVFWVVSRRPGRELIFSVGAAGSRGVVGAWLAATEGALPVQFSDGARLSFERGARGRIAEVSSSGADVMLENGHLRVEVVPGKGSHYRVSSGPFVVQVTGTRFDVEWHADADRFALELYEGHVRISGCAFGDGRPLDAGQRVEASCKPGEFRVSEIHGEPEVARADRPTTPVPQAPTQMRASVAETGPTVRAEAATLNGADADHWIALAKRGRYREAYVAADQAGFDRQCESRGAALLLLLGNSARLAGHVDRARSAYETIRGRFPGSQSAALSAFELGRVYFDLRGDFTTAERWLKVYLAEQPDGPLAPAAMGRLLEAEMRAGRVSSAQRIAGEYLHKYPKGAHADAAREVLGTPEHGSR